MCETAFPKTWEGGGKPLGKRLRDDAINLELVGGFNPFEKYYIVKLGIFPK